MTTDNFCFYLQNRLIQTSQTGGQWYSDTSSFSIPWVKQGRVGQSRVGQTGQSGVKRGRVGQSRARPNCAKSMTAKRSSLKLNTWPQ
jgi:hypothetical protein